MAFFEQAITVLQTLVIALGAGLGIWGVINLLEGYGNDNPGAKPPGISVTLPQRSLCGLHRLWGVHPAERHHLCLSVACAACIGKCSQNADRTFVDYAVSW